MRNFNTMGKAVFNFLEGGGKAGEEIRSFNWQNTSLGDPDGWPTPLKVSLRLMLDSAVPMQILWGKDFIHFYNDLYFPILESTGKSSLIGISGKQAFADVWDSIGYMLEDTLKGKAVCKKDFVFNFKSEEGFIKCYFDFSYNPIKLEDNTVGGVFVTVTETTERVNAVKLINDAKERYQFALNAAELGAYEYDILKKALFIDERTKEIFGFKNDDIISVNDLFSCMSNNDVLKVKNTFKSLGAGSANNKFDLKLTLNKFCSREEIVLKTKGMLLFNSEGVPIKFSGTVQDFTEEEKTRNTLKQNEQNLKNLFQNAPVAFCILKGRDFTVELANDKMLELIKRSASEIINKPAPSTFSSSVIEELIPALNSVYATGDSFIGNEYPLRILKNGVSEKIYVNFIAQFQPGIERIIVVAIDVTDQVLYRKNLEKNEHKFHEMANSLIQKVWSVDKDENILFLSERWEKYTGLPQTKDLFFNMVYPADLDQLNKDWEIAKENKSFFSTTIRLRNKDGEYRWQAGFANPILNEDGEVEKWIGTYSDIHEKKIAEESLKLQSFVLKSMDEGVCVWDENGYIIFTNPTQDIMHGFEEGELIGKHVSILNSVNANSTSLKEIQESIAKNGSWSGRSFNQSKDGVEFTIQSQIISVDLNGKNILVSVQRDITDELRRNLELSRFKYMVDNFNDPVVLIKEDGTFAYLNNIALEHWNYNQEEVLHLNIHDIFPGYSKKKFETAFKVSQKEKLPRFELKIVAGNGKTFPVEVSMSGLNLEDIPYLFAVIRDITDRKETEMRLALSLKQFKEMAETMPQFVWTSNSDGYLNYFNKSVLEYSGMSLNDLRGTGYLKMIHPDDQDANIKEWENSIKTGQPFMFEHRFKNLNNEYRWMLSRAVAQKNIYGEIELWVGTSTDIHDSKLRSDLLEQSVQSRTMELKKVNNRLKQSNSELEQFAYVASHDLQEPIRKIKTFASLLVESSKKFSESENNYLQKIISSSERMTVLINDILNFALLTHDEKSNSEVDLNEIINNVKLDLELRIESKNVTIKNDVLPVMEAIPIQMNQLFFNLMSNSLKFAKKDEPLIIEIKVKDLSKEEVKGISGLNEKNKYFEIIFKDNGMGFNQTYAEKIFNIFQRLNNKSFSGSGIGLALCRRIVIYQGGAIFAKGEENNGAEFHIVLPYKKLV